MATLGDIMTTDLLTVLPTATVAEAATMMGQRGTGSALVMEDDALLGIFTERDVVRALGQQFDAAGHPVSEWMTPDPDTVPPETTPGDALRTMLQQGFRHLPVAKDGRVVGIVSIRDLSAASER
ncbi:MAG: CBS domain-containing protein [Actinobacteria bacterium]|nr:CBS domain-containing protein [Actinomycetota bacterium]